MTYTFSFQRVLGLIPIDTHFPIISYYFLFCFIFTSVSFAWFVLAEYYKEKKTLPKTFASLSSFLQKFSLHLNKKIGSNSVAIAEYLKSGEMLKHKDNEKKEDTNDDDNDHEIKLEMLNKLMLVFISSLMFLTFSCIWLAIIL